MTKLMTLQLEQIDKSELPLRCKLNPCVTTSFLTGKTQLCGGNIIIETDKQVSIDEIYKYLVPEYHEFEQKSDIFISSSKQKFYETQVTGSRGDKYLVRLESDYWTCACVGFGFRRKCKHIDIARERYENS